MSNVTELGYLGFGVSNLTKWKEYATEVIGAEWFEEGDVAYLRFDLWHHRIILHQDACDDLLYVGWRVSDAQALDAMAEKLKAAKIKFSVGTSAEASQRKVMGLLKLMSPGDIPTEIFWGPQVDAHKPFHPGRPLFGRFKTGDNLGFAHIVLREHGTAEPFYKTLGFKGTAEYKVEIPGGIVVTPVFMYCNERQHSLAYALGPGAKRCHHMMLEYTDVKDMGQAHDIAKKMGVEFTMSIGTHANDGALSFYTASPSGWQVELGWGVQPPPQHQQYYVADIFGHGVGKDGDGEGYGLGVDDVKK